MLTVMEGRSFLQANSQRTSKERAGGVFSWHNLSAFAAAGALGSEFGGDESARGSEAGHPVNGLANGIGGNGHGRTKGTQEHN